MADPVTWGLAISAVVGAVGAVAQGSARAGQAQAQKQAAEYNAAIAQQNAALARQQAAVDAEQTRRTGERRMGAVRAAAAASGIGSASDVLADVAGNSELDRLLTLHKGDVAATGFENTATLDRSRAASFEAQAGRAETTGYLSAAGTLLKGGADIFSKLRQG